ncbi:MAG: hypothetical protein ACFFFG_02195 [Candidatus Thorarchaeota archaeon]
MNEINQRNKIDKPNPDNNWETFIRLPLVMGDPLHEENYTRIMNGIRFRIRALITSLRENNYINWCFFLIYGKGNGVPTRVDDRNMYFHLRPSFGKNLTETEIQNLLPD